MAREKSKKKSAAEIGDAVRPEFYASVTETLQKARSNSYRAVNFIMVEAYWNVGRMIVEEEQQGKERAEYGKALIRSLSERLTAEFGPWVRRLEPCVFQTVLSVVPNSPHSVWKISGRYLGAPGAHS